MENTNKKKPSAHLHVRALCEGAIMVALAFVLSFVKLYELPNGGSLTPAMFPILFYALRWGLGRGLGAGFVFGLLQLLFDGAYAWGWQSMILDYLLAFTPLGLAGLFRGKAWGSSPERLSAAWADSSFTTSPVSPFTGSSSLRQSPASAPLTMPTCTPWSTTAAT